MTARQLYDGSDGPFYAVHYNGHAYAAFSGANEALAYWAGLDAEGRRYFHIEDADGEKVHLYVPPGRPGHAYAILAALDKVDG